MSKQRTIRSTFRDGIVATALMAVVASGLGTIFISRTVADHQTQQYLLKIAENAASGIERAKPARLERLASPRGFTRDHLIQISSTGKITGTLPRPLVPSDLAASSLLRGHYLLATRGNMAFIAFPFQRTLNGGKHTFALVLTRPLPSMLLPALFVALVAIVSAGIAIFIADRYTRRISRSLLKLVAAADRIADGDLETPLDRTSMRERDLGNLAGALERMISSLKAASSSQATFLLAISHDLKTPLTSIRGFAEAIIDEAVEDPAAAAGTIIRESGRIEHLINDLISLARLSASHYSATRQPVDLASLLAHLSQSVTPRATANGLTIQLGLPDAALWASTDPERLLQLLGNLVDNAIKYANSKVMIEARLDHETTTITVADDGPGIPEHIRGAIFNQQVTPTPGHGLEIGSGLGLLIVARLASILEMELGYISPFASGSGTAFFLKIREPAHG